MADIRQLIWQAQNRKAFRRSSPTASPGVKRLPFGNGAAAPPSPTNPTSAMPTPANLPPPSRTLGNVAIAPEPTPASPASVATTNSNNVGITPAPTLSSTEQRLQDLMFNRQMTADMPIQDDDSKLHNFGAGATNAMRQMQRTGDSLGDLGMTLGLGIGGGLRGLFTKTEDDVRKREKNLKDIDAEREMLEKQKEKDIQNDFRVAQTKNIESDNLHQTEKLRLDTELKTEKQRDAKRTNFYKKYKYFDPANATEAQRSEAAEFGETPENIGKYDFSKAEFKQIGGATYKYNAATNAFEDTNLPKDGSKEIKDYKVTDTDGVEHVFRVSSDKAASLITSTKNAKMQIEAANQRQSSAQTFTAEQKDIDRRISLKKWATANNITRAKFKADLQTKVEKTELSQEQADAMLSDFDN